MKIEVNQITLNYRCEGEGSPLLLLHGNGEDHTIFDPLLEKLKKSFTVYAIDSRNHGGSSASEEFGYDAMAEDIYGFIVKLGLCKPAIVGFSDGAIVSLILSLKYPELLSRQALLGVNLKPTDFKDNVYAALVREYEKNNDPLYRLMLTEPDIEMERLRTINVPTLVVAGEKDFYKPELFRDIADTIPGARLLIMDGHDHSSYLAGTDLLLPALREFLG